MRVVRFACLFAPPILIAIGCSACSTVQSVDAGNAPVHARYGGYLNYAVARSIIVAQISAASSQAPSSASSATKSATGSASSPQTVSLSNTASVTVGAASPAASDTSKVATAPDASECAVLTSEYTGYLTYFASLVPVRESLASQLAIMAADSKTPPAPVPDPPAPAPAHGAVPTATADATPQAKLASEIADYTKAATATAYKDSLTDASSLLASIKADCPIKVKVALSQIIAPDWNRSFVLRGSPNLFYSDQIGLKVDSNGLPTSISLTSQDETPQILSAIASDVGTFTSPVDAFPAVPPKLVVVDKRIKLAINLVGAAKAATQKAACAPITVDDNGNPLADDALSDAIQSLNCAKTPQDVEAAAAALVPLLPPLQYLPALPSSSSLPITVAIPLDALEPATTVSTVSWDHTVYDWKYCERAGLTPSGIPAPTPLQMEECQSKAAMIYSPPDAPADPAATLADRTAERAHVMSDDLLLGSAFAQLVKYNVVLAASCSDRRSGSSDESPVDNPRDRVAGRLGSQAGVYDGIVVSASRACHVEAYRGSTDAQKAAPPVSLLAASTFWSQDSRYLDRLPIDRGFLVTHAIDYEFASGQQSGTTDNRPSWLLALVSLPSDIVSSWVGGLTSTITNKTNVTTGQTGLINAQAALIQAKAALATAKSKAAAAPAN